MEASLFSGAVRETVQRFGMDLSRPLVMVSGGPDSVALLRALVGLGSRPVVLHVDHGLRGEESRGDAGFVEGLCARLRVSYEERRIEPVGGNLQEGARRERYRLAEGIADERGLSAVATGHTADDVAETVLMNLARGAGLRGLSGIPPVRGRVARPLIERRRAEVLAYLEALDQPYRTDSTNLEPKYARNRVRLEVLPVLEALYPGAAGNIARGASLLREDLEALESSAARLARRRGDEVVLPLDELRALPPALGRHAVRRAHAMLATEKGPLDSAAVEELLALARKLAHDEKRGTRVMDLSGGVVAALRNGEELALYYGAGPPSGARDLLFGRQRFQGWILDAREVRGLDKKDAARPEVVYLDAGKGPYRVRMAREGDTIRPLGLGGTKKVMRAMMDRRVPKDLRRRTPVVVGPHDDEVAWVFLGELSEGHKVDGGTEKILRVEVEKTS